MRLFKIIFVAFLFMSCEELIELPNISTENVDLLAPSNGVEVQESSVQFNWSAVAEASHYQLQVAKPDFKNARQLVLDSVVFVDSTFAGTKIMKILENGEYQWRVRAMNSEYDTEFSTSSFIVSSSN